MVVLKQTGTASAIPAIITRNNAGREIIILKIKLAGSYQSSGASWA